MSKNVFANGKGVSAKKDENKSIAAMPDVCNSPPSPPAGPIPIPYPNTAQASDTSDGSKTVMIGGAEVGMKNSSNYKKSTGDEAATKSLGMNLTTATIQGIMKHAAWSMDVKIEGANAIRHMDMTTHNHMNTSGTGSLTLNEQAELIAPGRELTCEELKAANDEARANETGARYRRTPGAVTTAYRKPADQPGRPVPGYYMKAMTPHAPLAEFANDYEPPLDPDAYQPDCDPVPAPAGAPPRTRHPGLMRVNDAENKILHPEMTAGRGGMIKMSTWHNPGDAMPCYSCRQAICEAEDCGIEVWLCKSSEPPPIPPEAVRPADQGLCPPDEGQGDYDANWTAQGLGPYPPA